MSILKSNAKQILSIIIVFVLFTLNCGISVNAAVTCTIPYAATVSNKQIAANKYVRYSNELYLYPGDIVYLNFTYTSSSANVWFGLSTPSNQFRYASGTSGKLQRSFTIKEEGIHKVKIQNNSSASITVNGKFSTGCSYPFRGSSIPTALSRGYKTGHYGIDIIDTYPNDIDGREIYSIVSANTGKVVEIFDEPDSSTGRGHCVVIESTSNNVYGTSTKIRTIYMHMRYAPSVSKGNTVTKGSTQIGQVGNTGASGGTHLHYGVISDGSSGGSLTQSRTLNPFWFYPDTTFTYNY